jgi:hypothetical protein
MQEQRYLTKLLAVIERYVVMTDAQRLVVALWIVHSHAVEHFEQTPYLTVTSPQRQCGKSRLLELLELLVPRPWATIMPSEAIVYRKIEAVMPTLLLDEVDAIFAPKTADRHEGLRAILNAGHRRGATVDRAANFGKDLVSFHVYCPKVLAGIGVLPATITDRSIPIRLERKRRAERVEQFRLRTAAEEAEPIREGMARFAADNGGVLAGMRPEMPSALSDRMQEGCEPLVAIADALGYGEEARDALVELLAGARADEKESTELELLADIRDVFTAHSEPVMSSDALVMALVMRGGGDWGRFYGRGLTTRDIAQMLRHYGVHPKPVRTTEGVKRGYSWDDFYQVFERYLPPVAIEALATV